MCFIKEYTKVLKGISAEVYTGIIAIRQVVAYNSFSDKSAAIGDVSHPSLIEEGDDLRLL